MNGYSIQRLESLAQEIETKVAAIIDGTIKPYDQDLHAWATKEFAVLPSMMESQADALLEACTACLVDILSCDNASWDTPRNGFEASLARLRESLPR